MFGLLEFRPLRIPLRRINLVEDYIPVHPQYIPATDRFPLCSGTYIMCHPLHPFLHDTFGGFGIRASTVDSAFKYRALLSTRTSGLDRQI